MESHENVHKCRRFVFWSLAVLAFCSISFSFQRAFLQTYRVISLFETVHAPSESFKAQSGSDLLSSLVGIIGNITQVKDELLRGAFVNNGSQSRFDLAILKLTSSPPKNRYLRFAAAGGSITTGRSVPFGYFAVLENWLFTALKSLGIKTTFHNVAMGGTSSLYFAMCIEQHLNLSDYDVIFLEFSVNDGFNCGGIEELVRTIWRINPFLHIVYIHFEPPTYIGDLPEWDNCNLSSRGSGLHHLDVAKYYDIPIVQIRHVYAQYNLTLMSTEERISLEEMYVAPDGFHPNHRLHHFIAQFIIHYFSECLKRLLEQVSKSAFSELISSKKNMIVEETNNFMGRPLYQETWIDAVDCFMSITRPFKVSRALNVSLVDHSPDAGFVNFQVWVSKYVRNGRNLDTNIAYLSMPPSPNGFLQFHIQADLQKKFPCNASVVGYIPRLAFAHRLCNGCPEGQLDISAKYFLLNGAVVDIAYRLTLRSLGYNMNYVDFPKTLISNEENVTFCLAKPTWSMIEALHLDIRQRSKSYPFLLHGIIVAYDCCT